MGNNLEKEFVTYEQAKSLKGLKFDEPCFGYYEDVEVPNPFLVITKISDTQGGYFTFAPLKQQVFRWFRDKYEFCYHIFSLKITASDKTGYRYSWEIYNHTPEWIAEDRSLLGSLTYEEAENACIDKLLKIAKQQDNGMEINN
jgi:hypothetical protein